MSVYKEKNGKWKAEIRTTDTFNNPVRKRKGGFATKREALEWEREYRNILSFSTGITFETLYDIYFKDFKEKVKIVTYITKKSYVRKYILPYFKNIKIEDISPIIIRNFQTDVLKKADLKKATIRTLESHLVSILNFAVKYYNLPSNPFNKVDKIGSLRREKEMNIYNVEEFKTLIDLIPEKYYEYKIALQVLFWTGIRRGEMLALTVKDVNFKNKTLNIDKTFQRIQKEDYITAPKTISSIRKISLSNNLLEILREYISTMYEPTPHSRLFTFTESPLRNLLKKTIEKNNLKKIRVHDLRHSHASLLIHKKVNITAISKRLGHENIHVTLSVYSHLYEEDNTILIDTLNNL